MSNKHRRRSRSGSSVHGGVAEATTGTALAGDDDLTDLVADHPYNYAKTSGRDIIFTASTDDITSATGSFVTDGWVAGMTCEISSTANNEKTVVILAVLALTMTLAVGETLTDETVGAVLTSVNQTAGDNVNRAPV